MIISISTEDRLKDRDDEERKVIFLDIDGVLQPTSSQERFEHDMEALKKELAEEYKDEHFLELDKYDVGAVYYDWDKTAVSNLHKLLSWCDAEIVLSSDWRQTKTLEDMKCLMKIHKLDQYLTEMVPETRQWSWKYEDIPAYLSKHPKLSKYVVVDDMNMEKYFRGRFVRCDRYLGQHEYNQIYRLLEYGPWWEDTLYKNYTSGNLGRTIEDKFDKVIFLDIDGVLNDDGERKADGEIICEEYVWNLKEIVNKTNAEIILSSSWRYGAMGYARSGFSEESKGMSELLRLFDKYDLKIAGITPMIRNGPDGRPLEIRTWLSRRPEVSGFVILDDETFWNWKWLTPFVVTTSYLKADKNDKEMKRRVCGLERRDAYEAIEILNNKQISGNEE